MNIRVRFRSPAPNARKVCKHCENRRALFRAEGLRKWDPYYALCYRCYQRYISRARAEQAPPAGAATAAGLPGRTLALETGLQPAR